jgi:diacylglycerol kinase (CTP)
LVFNWCYICVIFLSGVRLCSHFLDFTSPPARDIAVVSILILSWADTAASTIGRLWGRYTPPLPRRIPYLGLRFAPRKSTAGYAAAWITGGLITSAFLGYHSLQTPYPPVALPNATPFSWSQFATSTWEDKWTMIQPFTNFNNVSVSDIPSSWNWNQRVGGGWPGLVVMGLWSGFVTAIAEAMGK